jgi:hypothetical protein
MSDTMQITVYPAADLTVESVDASAMAVGGYTHEVSGQVSAVIADLGPGPVGSPFSVIFFDDVDAD